MRATFLGVGPAVAGIGATVSGFLSHPHIARGLMILGVLVGGRPVRLHFLGDHRPERVRRMARLLCEAAAGHRAMSATRQEQHGVARTIQEAAEWGGYYGQILKFLNLGFTHQVRQDYRAFEQSRKQKLGEQFELENECAEYLETLAGRLALDDLDRGFLIPNTFEQFAQSDWPHNTPD